MVKDTQLIKQQIRLENIAKCISLPLSNRKTYSKDLLIHSLPLLLSARQIAIYHAYGWEINLQEIIKYALANNKKLYQPIAYCDNKIMDFIDYDANCRLLFYSSQKLADTKNCSNLLGKMLQTKIEWYNLDLIFLPLVGVDKQGNRLGKGGGYYDSTLAKRNLMGTRPILCGVGYSCQMVDNIPSQTWDVQLDCFVAENGLVWFNR